MIGDLKDIWIIFKKVYNEHFALKHEALDAIKKYESRMNIISRVSVLMNEANSDLIEVYRILPIKDHQDFVQDTIQCVLNRLEYAVKSNHLSLGYGLREIYSNLYSKLEYDYDYIKTLYKEKKYDKVIKDVNDMLEYLDNLYLEYDKKYDNIEK